MWIITGIASIIFCVIAIGMVVKKKQKAGLASICSLSFVAITLLMQYRLVLKWVDKEDWSALMDVVPSMFMVLCGYVIIMILVNVMVVITTKRQ